MRGYFNGHTEFKDRVSRLVSALDKYRSEAESATPHCPNSIVYQHYNPASQTLIPIAADSREFNDQLLNNTVPTDEESPLQNMLLKVVKQSSGNNRSAASPSPDSKSCPAAPINSSLSILITDSIFSYPDEIVRKNPSANKDNIQGIASDVEMIFNEGHQLGKFAALLAFKSQFHGTYYDYRNDKSQCCSALRPYYFWIIGSQENLKAVRELLLAENVTPERALDFGADPFDLSPVILQYTDAKGLFYRHNGENPKRIRIARPFSASTDTANSTADNSAEEVGFAVAVNLSRLSPDQLRPEYLAAHLSVLSESPDLHIKSVIIKSRAEMESELDNRDRPDVPDFTHVLLITTDFNFSKSASLDIVLDEGLPHWYLDWSSDDDSETASQLQETTFGLRYFVDAIAQAYHMNNPVAKATIVLER
jgi:hypothetical protein